MKLYEIIDLALKGALSEMQENEDCSHISKNSQSYEYVGHRAYIRACKNAYEILGIIIGEKDIEDARSEQ